MPMSRVDILIVEDETVVALDIQDAILSMGYNCIGMVTNYSEVLEVVQRREPTIILMDINLENSISGIEIVQNLKELNYEIPIIYLTAYTDEYTIQKAIATAPVGYIVKPFQEAELKATIMLGLQKIEPQKSLQNHYVKIDDNYAFDYENSQLFYQMIPLKLSKKELALFKLLLEAKGNVVSFQDIEYNLWDTTVSEATLRVLLFRLRSKLDYELIESVASFGCRLIIK